MPTIKSWAAYMHPSISDKIIKEKDYARLLEGIDIGVPMHLVVGPRRICQQTHLHIQRDASGRGNY
jgi:hypothetical protein